MGFHGQWICKPKNWLTIRRPAWDFLVSSVKCFRNSPPLCIYLLLAFIPCLYNISRFLLHFNSLPKVNIKRFATVNSNGFSQSKENSVTSFCLRSWLDVKCISVQCIVMLNSFSCFTVRSPSNGAKHNRPILKFILWNVEP